MRLAFLALVLLMAAALALPRSAGCAQRTLRALPPRTPGTPAGDGVGAALPAGPEGGTPPGGQTPAQAGGLPDDPPPGGQVVQAAPIPARAWVRAHPEGVVMLVIDDTGIRPPLVHAELGGRVRLLVANHGRRPHNLVIPDFHLVGMTLAPGEENYIEFTAGEKGDFPMFSDAPHPGEPEPGLVAVLKVR